MIAEPFDLVEDRLVVGIKLGGKIGIRQLDFRVGDEIVVGKKVVKSRLASFFSRFGVPNCLTYDRNRFYDVEQVDVRVDSLRALFENTVTVCVPARSCGTERNLVEARFLQGG